ncbi:MAG: NAD-dependent epimerase/dehydratase family protein [Flavobacteriaceae bacterium]
MKVLVTGVAGFIGSHLAEHLSDNGFEVIGIDNFNNYYDSALKRLNAKHIAANGVQIIEADLCDDLSAKLPHDIDYVFHFAGQPGISNTTTLQEYVDNNIYATENLLQFVKTHNKPLKLFVNIATSSVYGSVANLPETAVVKPISYYGITKFSAEQLVLKAQRANEMKACSFRLYSVYGPRERPEKLYTKLIKSIVEDTNFPLFDGSLKHSRSFTYVGDIVAGLMKCIGREEQCDGEIINLGSDKEYTTGDGIALIEKIIGKPAKLEITAPRDGDQLKTTAVIDKARELLDYSPETSFEDGLRQQVDWYMKYFS